jgi:hypothetical protein
MILTRLKYYIDSKGITVSAFERSVGMSNASFGKSLKTGGAIGSDKLENILSTYPDINPVWLMTGSGSMLSSEEQHISLPELQRDHHLIPLYDTIAIAGRREMDMSPVSEPAEYIDAGDWFRDATAAMRIHGDSMYPSYHSGCIAALKEVVNKDLIMYGEDYVIETIEFRTLKRIQKGIDGKHILACSANTERWEDGSAKGRLIHEPFDVPRDEIKRLFLVLGSVRRNHSSRIVFNRYK